MPGKTNQVLQTQTQQLSFSLLFHVYKICGYHVHSTITEECPTSKVTEEVHSDKPAMVRSDSAHASIEFNSKSFSASCVQTVRQKCTNTVSCIKALLTFLKTHIVYLFLSVLFFFGSLRLLVSWFSSKPGMNSSSVVTASFAMNTLSYTLIYCLQYIGFGTKHEKLVSATRIYESKFGFKAFDVAVINKRLKQTFIGVYFLSLVNVLPVNVTFYFLYPDKLRELLVPFQHVHGQYFILATVVYCVVVFLSSFFCYGVLFTISWLTYVFYKEFHHIGKLAANIFKQGESVKPSKCGSKTFSANSSERCLDCVPRKTESKKHRKSYPRTVIRSRVRGIFSRHQSKSSPVEHAITTVSPKPCWKPEIADTVACSPEPNGREIAEVFIDDVGVPETVKTHNQRVESSQPAHVKDAIDLEKAFDDLRDSYEALCEVVACTQQCFSHVFPIALLMSTVSVCYGLYTVSSGVLSGQDQTIGGGNVFACVGFIIFYLLTGCYVHDAAKAILNPLYSCSWASFPPSLVQKMQFLSMRVMSGEVGYHVYGLFVVSRPTILMLGGTILTYTVVVVQFQMGTCNCGPGNTTAI